MSHMKGVLFLLNPSDISNAILSFSVNWLKNSSANSSSSSVWEYFSVKAVSENTQERKKKKRKRKGTCVYNRTIVLPMLIWDSLKKKAIFNWQNCIEEYSFSRPDLWFMSREPAIRESGQFQGWNSINHLPYSRNWFKIESKVFLISKRSFFFFFSFLKYLFLFLKRSLLKCLFLILEILDIYFQKIVPNFLNIVCFSNLPHIIEILFSYVCILVSIY